MKAVLLLTFVASALAVPYDRKVNPSISKSFQHKSRLNIFVSFEGTKDALGSVSQDNQGRSQGDQATAVYKALKAHAQKTQTAVLAMLHSPKYFTLKVESFWISNQIYIKGADANLIGDLAGMAEVKRIDEEITVKLDDPTKPPTKPTTRVEWGIQTIQAEEAWAVAGDGDGATVGIIDTGARFTHEAILHSYRGGTHAWYDPYRSTPEPGDLRGHGTHVTGTIAGKFGIGVAPGAKWISCKGLDDTGDGTEEALKQCGQFMLCPTDHVGENPDCSLAPQVVSCSWGTMGGGFVDWFDTTIDAWHAANIIPVFAAGNMGPLCDSIGYPADSTSVVIAVGATNVRDQIAWFSSPGPSVHAGALKPDITAPGEDVRSAGIEDDASYSTQSGTSMAAPHVAGLVSLLKSNNPHSTYEEIWNILTTSTDHDLNFGNAECDGISESTFPNFHFGHGRINALSAVSLQKSR